MVRSPESERTKTVKDKTHEVIQAYISFLEKAALDAISKGDIELADDIYGKLTRATGPLLGMPQLSAPFEKQLEFLSKAEPQDVQAIAVSQILLLNSYTEPKVHPD